jgi:hypothetical protein
MSARALFVVTLLFSLFAAVCGAQAQFASVDDLSADELRKAIDDARLSLDVYHPSKTIQGGWRMISDPTFNPTSLQAAAYERVLGNGKREIVVAFAGTRGLSNMQDVRDWLRVAAQFYDDGCKIPSSACICGEICSRER